MLVCDTPEQQLDDLQPLQELGEVRYLVLRDVGAKDEHDQAQAVAAQVSADDILYVARHVAHEIHREVAEVVRDLVDRKLRVERHGSKSLNY